MLASLPAIDVAFGRYLNSNNALNDGHGGTLVVFDVQMRLGVEIEVGVGVDAAMQVHLCSGKDLQFVGVEGGELEERDCFGKAAQRDAEGTMHHILNPALDLVNQQEVRFSRLAARTYDVCPTRGLATNATSHVPSN